MNLKQLQEIKQVKDSSPFTCEQSIHEYLQGVRFRISQWIGIPIDEVTDSMIYEYIVEK